MPDHCISVITPCFNSIAHIDECVRQVIDQGSVVREHIIVDGGSTDGTVERIAELKALHPHIVFIPGPDRGQSDAMNKGTALAQGAYISILNVDDRYEPCALQEMATEIGKQPVPAFVSGNCKIVDENDTLLHFNEPNDLRFEALLIGGHLVAHPANPCAYIYHKEVHDIIGGYVVDEHYAMDLEFIFSAAEKVEMVYVDRLWGTFRYLPGTKTHTDKAANASRSRADTIRERYIGNLDASGKRKFRRIKLEKTIQRQWWLAKVRSGKVLGMLRSSIGLRK